MDSNRTRILMIAPLPPPVHGSAMMTRYIKDSAIINKNVDMDWINLSTSRSMDEIGKQNPNKIVRFILSYIKTLWKLSTRRYDKCYLAITCHGKGFLKDAPFALLCKLFRKPIIIHQHNKGMSRYTDKHLYRPLLKAVYKDASVILLSEKLYNDISQIVIKKQIQICPNGIPDTAPRGRTPLNSVPNILFLSNLMESKGVWDLLDACKILKEQGYNFRCKFVGGETKEIDKERFNQGIEIRNLTDTVVYLGRKYGTEKEHILNSSDIFVFPTYEDCFPLVLLEAMQAHLPIISTDEGGITDIITDKITGLITNKHDAHSLANNIATLLDSPELRTKLGEAAYKDFLTRFTIRKFEERIEELLVM